MRNARAANQRRSLRNRQNRRNQPITPLNPHRHPIRYHLKTKYENSQRREDGVLLLSKRKRALPTPEQLQEKKRKALAIKTAQVARSSLQHKVVNLYETGCFTERWQFPAHSNKNIINFLQQEYPEKYSNRSTAESFFYRTIKKHKDLANSPHLDPFRERRGENKRKPKRENPRIVELCDEWFSEPNSTAPKIQASLAQHGFTVSKSTIYRIAKDLCFKWTKPWYTDVLTPAQKLKRKLFCAQLLRLPDRVLLERVADYLFTDEKWWDIVGPSMSRYVKAGSKTEAKLLNQVCNV